MTSALPERSDAANADTVATLRQTVGVCLPSPDGKAAPSGRPKELVEFFGLLQTSAFYRFQDFKPSDVS